MQELPLQLASDGTPLHTIASLATAAFTVSLARYGTLTAGTHVDAGAVERLLVAITCFLAIGIAGQIAATATGIDPVLTTAGAAIAYLLPS